MLGEFLAVTHPCLLLLLLRVQQEEVWVGWGGVLYPVRRREELGVSFFRRLG